MYHSKNHMSKLLPIFPWYLFIFDFFITLLLYVYLREPSLIYDIREHGIS